MISSRVAKTGFDHGSIQLVYHPATHYKLSDCRKVIDELDHRLDVCQKCDLHDLQAIVSKTLKEATEGEEVVLGLQTTKKAMPPLRYGNECLRGKVFVFSDGDVVCTWDNFTHITLEFEDTHRGGPVPVLVYIALKGAPGQQVDGHANARQQMVLMHQILASKLSANFDGRVFGQLQEAAKKIADMIHEGRSELQEHFIIDTVLAQVSLTKEQKAGTGSVQQEEIRIEGNGNAAPKTEEKPAALVKDIDYTIAGSLKPPQPSEIIDGEDGPRSDTHVRMPPAGSNVHEDAVAIVALLQELDSRLHSVMPTPSADAVVSDGPTSSVQPESTVRSRSKMQRGVVVALGSNVGNRIEEIEKACRAIDADPEMRIVDTSYLYETKPMYVEDQGHFVNGACEVSGSPGGRDGGVSVQC